ncbi:hypothetical protein K438DRAFT_1799030 [Mycena galopus ATCC 62051]|nr:hypothetical protein K438DRAFT_1799030 [Mycena galopus ATCC 62051]
MSGTELLIPDLLSDIMLRLPSDITQKFAMAQVSRYWREVTLNTHLFWSSFVIGPSKKDCYRVPIVLERSGSVFLHVRFNFPSAAVEYWHTEALKALVRHVARIESLHVYRPTRMTYPLSSTSRLPPGTFDALLNSNLEFCALQTLRLRGSPMDNYPTLLLKAPRLRILDIECFTPANMETLLSPQLENIRIYEAEYETGLTPLKVLFHIFTRCPRAARIVLRAWRYTSPSHRDADFEVFARQRPLAPALRELNLDLGDYETDFDLVLKAGFPDVVLPSLIKHTSIPDVVHSAGALLAGLGPLVVFDMLNNQEIELRDDAGHFRRLVCETMNDDQFQVNRVWEYLSIHYNLHKTVREIQIDMSDWDDYAEVFERYPPQRQDGITFIFEAGDVERISKIIHIAGLAKVELEPYLSLSLASVSTILEHIQPSGTRKVEVCIHSGQMWADAELDAFGTALSRSRWEICSQCVNRCVH